MILKEKSGHAKLVGGGSAGLRTLKNMTKIVLIIFLYFKFGSKIRGLLVVVLTE